jgi:uroporphyrinogen-III decarboxylase
MLHRGGIMLRDDSAMNLSPQMFERFVRPYDQRLLDEFGGGAIHFCGKGDHYISRLSEMQNLHSIHMTEPQHNEMETIYAHTVDRGIHIIGLQRAAAEATVATGRDLHGRVHCF